LHDLALLVVKNQLEEHEDIVNIEKPLLRKMKISITNKPKKVVKGSGPSPLKRGKKLNPKPILEWVSIATTTRHATIKNT
jgi:hypothetical protein